MIVLEDFTQVRVGRDIPAEGHVRRCPRCGRAGIEQRSGGESSIFVHAQTSEVLGDGMLIEPRDYCSLPR